QALARFIETTGITIWNSVPTLWMLLLDAIEQLEAEGEAIRLERLRWVLIGGEDLPANHVRRWWDRFGPRHRIANVYGGAETITNCLYHVVPARPADGEIRIPIGVSAAGAEPLILDEHGGVERGDAVGEIAIGGPKLAVGYLDDPERTAAVFVPHPEGRGRIYRTGDLGRRDAAGNIVFLGRADSQVKIHGHRVELSEIENTLNLHPAVRAAAVLLHDDGHHQRLEAYLEPARPGAECDVRELRGHLEPRLPAYMVPHRFTWVAALPRNPIGKIDRRALRPPGAAPAAAASPAPDPRRTQAIVADAWRQVLGVAAVKPEDDFFELGGDSILALEVLQRLRGKVPVLPRPITLYGERTLARLAAAIDGLAGNGNRETGRRGDDRGSVAPSSTEHGSSAHRTNHPQGPPRLPASLFNCDGRLPLTPTQESFVLAQRLRPEVSPVWCARLPLRGALDPTLLGRALAAVVERHDLLRTVFETDAGLKTWQRVLPPAGAALAVEDLTRLPPAEREARLAAWFAAEQRSRFDLDRWPLWRFRLVALDDERWELLVTMHHAVADGWSCHVLGAELIAAYRQLAQGAPVALPPLASTFADVVAAAPAGGADEHAAARRYWAERFARPWPDVRRLGAARDDAAVSPHVILDEATTTALRRHAAGARRSLHALVLAAWARALTRATGDRDLVLGCALAGRDLPVPGADRLFGPLATALPLRLEVGGGAFADDLGTVDAAFTAACVHAGLPVDELLRQIPRHPGAPYPPGRQLFFTFMDFSALPPLGDAGLAVDLDAARFHFAAQATDTEMMLGALAGTRLRLHVHGQAAADRRAAALEEVARELAALVRAPAVTEPRAPAPAPAPAAAPVALDAAVVAYLPDPRRLAGLLPAGVDLDGARAFVRRALFPAAAPRLAEVQQTRLGSSGAVMLPYFADELASVAPDELAERAAEAVELCERHGARCVSFAGLLPSATRYGVAIARALERRRGAAPDAPRARVTTGHAATAAAVVANVAHVLEAVGARLPDLAVAVVGFGSIGQAALRLLLATQPAPRALAVSDLAREREHLRAPLADLARLAPGPIAFLPWEGAPPAALDDYDLIIGASSAGGLLDPERLRPGTLLVDDSFPPLCEEAAAVRRMTARQDVLIVGGGTLAIAAEQLDLPLALPGEAAAAALRAFATRGMPGCRAESLLISREPSLPAALGLVDPDAAARYWRVLADLAIAPAPLHCGAFTIPAVIVDAVRRRRA
ncbi:MAG TPA: condensation domain-containing protein, partial [Polyangia bacterium]